MIEASNSRLYRALVSLVVLFVCVSTGYTAYHLAAWLGTGSEWAGLLSLVAATLTLVAIEKPT